MGINVVQDVVDAEIMRFAVNLQSVFFLIFTLILLAIWSILV